ncbi:MAG TPA: two-component regulator propeller domain-containing protein, partial [Sphingobacterium sp.]|nr:two-component regulator propeller domain-containing protein [Sphingobacterium sp.]
KLNSNQINFLHEDQNGKLWVGTGLGLNCLLKDGEGGYKSFAVIAKETNGLNITKVVEDQLQVYFSTTNGTLITFNKSTQKIVKNKVSGSAILNIGLSNDKQSVLLVNATAELLAFDIRHASFHVLRRFDEGVQGFFEDRYGNFWLDPTTKGAIFWNRKDNSVKHLYSPIRRNDANVIFRCFEDINGTVWVSFRGGGFGYYDYETATLVTRNEDILGNQLAFPQQIYELYYDGAGVVWLSTEEKGLIKLVIQNKFFERDNLSQFIQSGDDSEVRSLLFDGKGRLWLGAKGGDLLVKQKGVYAVPPIEKFPSQGFSGIYTLFEDRKGRIWIGTKEHGVFVASPNDSEKSAYGLTNYHDKNSGLPVNQIYSILQDDSGDIWVGTFGGGLVKVEEDGGVLNFKPYPITIQGHPEGRFDRIRNLALDDYGNIWIATTYGLIVQDKKGKIVVFRDSYEKQVNIGANDLQYLFKRSNGEMWICTSGGGVSRALGDPFVDLTFTNYTEDNGLSNDYVLSGTEDLDGNLWFATEAGISKYVPSRGHFFSFDAFQGQTGFSFSEKTVAKSSFGEIIWGTSKGVIFLDPHALSNNKTYANLVFSRLLVNNKDMVLDASRKGQEFNVQYADRLVLDHHQNNISIDYNIIDYRHQHHNYLYRLKGLDTTWQNNQQLNRITFTNLKPGNYVLEVKGQSDLYQESPFKSLPIVILPPWWRTWWAHSLYLLFFIAALIVVIRVLSTMIQLKNKVEIEKKVAELKMDFFTSVSHELRTPLTLILSPVKYLLNKEKLSVQGEQYMNMVYRNAVRMETFVNQLLDLRKIQENKFNVQFESFDITALIEQVVHSFQPLAKEREMRVRTVFPIGSIFIQADEKHVETMLFNMLSNSFKYSPNGTEITVSLDQDDKRDTVLIRVSDQGSGVPENKLNHIFELFYVESQTAAKSVKGSGVGLALTKELVDLHHGDIRAFNNAERGLSVVVTLPLKQRETSNTAKTTPDNPGWEERQAIDIRELPMNAVDKPIVLVVEDHDELRNFLKMQLEVHYTVLTAEDGVKGLATAEEQMPDMIVSDIMMPQMDGITMLDRIRRHQKLSHIPVVLLSAKHAVESQMEGMQYGADFYITKPFHTDFLLSSLDNLLRRRTQFFSDIVERREVVLKPSDLVITDTDEAFLKDVVNVVEEKMSDPDFNIDMVADGLNMSRNTFYKKFKSLT